MTQRLRCAVVTLASILLLAGDSSLLLSQTADDLAADLVREALHREIYGQVAARDRLLEKARERSPRFAPAYWHQGKMRRGNEWVTFDRVIQLDSKSAEIATYQQRRQDLPDDIPSHLTLANLCRDSGLEQQERAHLSRIVDLNPDHGQARTRLGFVRVGSQWATTEQTEQARARDEAWRQRLAEWGPTMVSLRSDLRNPTESRRESAAAAIRSIDNPEAIPAMESVLSTDSEAASFMVIDSINRMNPPESTWSLARHAVFSPSERARTTAATRLGQRRRESFVPEMLASMFTPITSQTRLAPGPGGRLAYVHRFMREGQDRRNVVELDTRYDQVLVPGNSGRSLVSAARDAFRTAVRREWAISLLNERTQQLNERIASALNVATNQQLPPAPHAWWQWWNDENEVFLQGEKPTRTSQRTQLVFRFGRVQVPQPQFGDGSQTPPPQRGDCFAAGTPVWTNTGPKSIELVRVGDLVLSQAIDTGELTYQPVVRTTVRPEGPLVRIEAGGEVLESSGGHLLWVAGEGWVKARELVSGMQLHACDGPVPVIATEASSPQETYNLVVPGFHSYFVGTQRVLSHDNTIRRPTTVVVPGLSAD